MSMQKKTFRAPIEFKAEGTGEFRATFATLNVVDKDGDLTVPGAFPIGQPVVIEPWNHGQTLPVGQAAIDADQERAWVEGRFLLETTAGKEHYETVKALGPLTEWSYSFWILDAAWEVRDEEQIRVLKQLDVAGVGPVTRGAGIGTRTDSIKSAGDGSDDTGEGDESQDGDPVEPSGPPPSVVAVRIDIDMLEAV